MIPCPAIKFVCAGMANDRLRAIPAFEVFSLRSNARVDVGMKQGQYPRPILRRRLYRHPAIVSRWEGAEERFGGVNRVQVRIIPGTPKASGVLANLHARHLRDQVGQSISSGLRYVALVNGLQVGRFLFAQRKRIVSRWLPRPEVLAGRIERAERGAIVRWRWNGGERGAGLHAEQVHRAACAAVHVAGA